MKKQQKNIMIKFVKECYGIMGVIINTIVYGSGKDRLQIIKDMVNCESWLYE